jgi:hypothetical protein
MIKSLLGMTRDAAMIVVLMLKRAFLRVSGRAAL